MKELAFDIGETTDILDVYDEDGKYLGVKNRKIVHDEGCWHYSIHCWMVCLYRGETHLVLQKRKANKRLFPLKYDIAAAGHYVAGEHGDIGMRELAEELRLPVDSFDYTFFKTMKCCYQDASIVNNEFCNVYLCRLSDAALLEGFNREELEDVVLVKVGDCLALLEEKKTVACAYSIGSGREITLQKQEFIAQYTTYFVDTMKAIAEGSVFARPEKHYTFVMLKPDAVERKFVSKIVRFLTDAGFTLELMDVKYAWDDIVFRHYAEKIQEEGEIYKVKASKYFNGKPVVPMVISHPSGDAISLTRKLIGFRDPSMAEPDTIRGKWGIDTMERADAEIRCCENLIHASDSVDSFARECLLWFDRHEVERYIRYKE